MVVMQEVHDSLRLTPVTCICDLNMRVKDVVDGAEKMQEDAEIHRTSSSQRVSLRRLC